MAIVTRYFSTASAGAADGTTWADRAQLVNAGAWSTILTGFNFSGTDSLVCKIGPGTYSPTASLTAASFTNAPTAANILIFQGCDSSGNSLTPANSGWTSDQAAWDDSGLPLFSISSSISVINIAAFFAKFIRIVASGGTSSQTVASCSLLDWCSVENQNNNSAGFLAGSACLRITNSLLKMSGATFRCVYVANGNAQLRNNKLINTGGGSAGGNRHAIEVTTGAGTVIIDRCQVSAFQGSGIAPSGTPTAQILWITRNTINGCTTGIRLSTVASQTQLCLIQGNLVTGNSTAGIDGGPGARAIVSDNRLRDNNSQDLINLANYPADFPNYTTAGSDAAEYVNTAVGDYRVKVGSAIWGKGYGVSDQPALIVVEDD